MEDAGARSNDHAVNFGTALSAHRGFLRVSPRRSTRARQGLAPCRPRSCYSGRRQRHSPKLRCGAPFGICRATCSLTARSAPISCTVDPQHRLIDGIPRRPRSQRKVSRCPRYDWKRDATYRPCSSGSRGMPPLDQHRGRTLCHGGRLVADDVLRNQLTQLLESALDLSETPRPVDLVGREAQPYDARSGQIGQFQIIGQRISTERSRSAAAIRQSGGHDVRWTICRRAKRAWRRGITSSCIRCSISKARRAAKPARVRRVRTTCPEPCRVR